MEEEEKEKKREAERLREKVEDERKKAVDAARAQELKKQQEQQRILEEKRQRELQQRRQLEEQQRRESEEQQRRLLQQRREVEEQRQRELADQQRQTEERNRQNWVKAQEYQAQKARDARDVEDVLDSTKTERQWLMELSTLSPEALSVIAREDKYPLRTSAAMCLLRNMGAAQQVAAQQAGRGSPPSEYNPGYHTGGPQLKKEFDPNRSPQYRRDLVRPKNPGMFDGWL